MKLFEDIGLSNELLTSIKRLGFKEPTQIQEESIPHIIKGKDVIGESATGSGKTLAFGCGIIEQVIPGKGLQALILTPTRELTEQVKNALRQFSNQKRLKIISVYGGVSISNQIDDLPRADVVVATPGRLLDHLGRGTIDLSKVRLLVLDEADRMLDMGFIEDVEQIIQACPKERQTLCFSATISWQVKDLVNQYMNQPIEVLATKMVDPSKLKQVYYDVARNMKLSLLVHMLQNEKTELAMIFCNSRRSTDFVVKNLRSNKIKASAIHGGMSQNKRTKTINLFNEAKTGVLICTDVAARGLHINNVSHIYNYEIPKDPKDYIHRIGRTARAGEEGIAINFLCDYDYDSFSRILDEYDSFSIENVKTPYLKRVMVVRVDDPRRRSIGDYRQGGRPFNGNHSYGRRWN